MGTLTLDCDVLTVAGSDLRIMIDTAEPGTADAERLACSPCWAPRNSSVNRRPVQDASCLLACHPGGSWTTPAPTSGLSSQLPPATLEALLTSTRAAIDAVGGSFTMGYATVAVTATRPGAA